MHSCKPSCSQQAGLASAAGLALLLLCLIAAAHGAQAGPRCPSGLLCPDDGWFCCAPGRESCCKNIGTGGPFGRRLKTIEMVPSDDPLGPPTVNIWQAGRLLHTTSNTANRHLLQMEKGPTDGAQVNTAQEGAKLSEQQDMAVPGDGGNPLNNQRPTLSQLAMSGTATGRGSVPTRITVEGFYADRDQEVRPWSGGDGRLEDNSKKGVKGPLTRQKELLKLGLDVADRDSSAGK